MPSVLLNCIDLRCFIASGCKFNDLHYDDLHNNWCSTTEKTAGVVEKHGYALRVVLD